MLYPLVRPVTNMVDRIHNSSTPKNQDELLPFRGESRYFLLRDSVAEIYGPSGMGNMPRTGGASRNAAGDRPTRSLGTPLPKHGNIFVRVSRGQGASGAKTALDAG
jgi:hypothetical protein